MAAAPRMICLSRLAPLDPLVLRRAYSPKANLMLRVRDCVKSSGASSPLARAIQQPQLFQIVDRHPPQSRRHAAGEAVSRQPKLH